MAKKIEKRMMTKISVATVTPKTVSENSPLALHSLITATVEEGERAMAKTPTNDASTVS